MTPKFRVSFLAVAVWAAAAIASSKALADDATARVALSWTAPSECIDAASLEHAVETMLEHPVWARPESADVAMDASLVRENGEWVLRLALRNGAVVLGTREARRTGRDCRAIDGIIIVVVALLVDLPKRDVQLR